MKVSSVFLFVVAFTFSLPAQEPASFKLPPAGPNRPAEVPADYVITPFGYFHPSCVLTLKKGEYRTKERLLHHADGSETPVAPCNYPHFAPSGVPGVAGNSHDAPAKSGKESTVKPAIGHSWVENSNVTTTAAYGKEVSTWTVPPLPLTQDGQTIYFFPGFEDLNDVMSILQPVIGSYDGSQWSMASWNCCLAGTADQSNPIAISPGDKILGTTEMTCAAGTTSCSTWNVITEDQTINQSTELTATPSDGQSFNWAFGGVLEVYNVDQCLDYPAGATLTITSLLYDQNFNQISSPNWSGGVGLPSSVQPQCNYALTTTATQTKLTYGTTGPGFGLGITPAAGIAVNQGSSATGAITITDVNGFTGSVNVALSNPPSDITAKLAQGSTKDTYTLTVSATSAAALTGANQPAFLTLTATGSGVPTQTFPVSVIVNPPLTGGVGTAVDLASAYNVYAFFNDDDGWPALNSTDSLDTYGDAYSANQLNPPALSPMALDLNGVHFDFGIPNQANAVYGTGANPIALPAVQAAGFQILGTGFNGPQQAQTILVTYTDNSTQTFTQTFDDWSTGTNCNSSNGCTPGESAAVAMPYVDTQYSYPRIDSIYYLYDYSFALNSAKTIKSLTLPNNRSVVVLAVSLVGITATPTFSPAGGTINAPALVDIADSTPGAVIYYTTDGSTPTSSSTVYSTAISVSATETLNAIAIASGDNPSAVATATYTFVPPNFSVAGTAVSVNAGATTGNTSTVTLTPSGGFTGAIGLTCAITPTAASDPATCSIPASATINGPNAQTALLTITTTAPTSALNQPGKLFWPSVGGTALACFLLVGIPARQRKRWTTLAMLIFALSILAGALGCGKSSSNGGGQGNPGTTPGNYVVTVTGTSGAITQSTTVSLTVQ